MAWSIFKQAGGQGLAVSWARSLLGLIGAPVSAGNVQMIYDWELAEGGGGTYNPLNQGPVPGHPELTTTGSQYGGGAADFTSWQAGLQGAADYLGMSNYAGIKSALVHDQAAAARAALIASPWAASHYGGGSGLPSTAVPAVPGGTDLTGGAGGAGGGVVEPVSDPTGISDSITAGLAQLRQLAIVSPFVVGGLVLVVLGAGYATRDARRRAGLTVPQIIDPREAPDGR